MGEAERAAVTVNGGILACFLTMFPLGRAEARKGRRAATARNFMIAVNVFVLFCFVSSKMYKLFLRRKRTETLLISGLPLNNRVVLIPYILSNDLTKYGTFSKIE